MYEVVKEKFRDGGSENEGRGGVESGRGFSP